MGYSCPAPAQEKRGMGVAMPRITGSLLMLFFWILRTGAPWRDLLSDLGGWSNTHQRFLETMRFGTNYWIPLLMIPIWNGL